MRGEWDQKKKLNQTNKTTKNPNNNKEAKNSHPLSPKTNKTSQKAPNRVKTADNHILSEPREKQMCFCVILVSSTANLLLKLSDQTPQLPTLYTKVKDTKLPRWSLRYVNLDTVMCPGANMALWRGWKGEAEEANRIKGRFCQYTCRSASRKGEEGPDNYMLCVGRKQGRRVTVTLQCTGPEENNCHEGTITVQWEHQQKGEIICFLLEVWCMYHKADQDNQQTSENKPCQNLYRGFS